MKKYSLVVLFFFLLCNVMSQVKITGTKVYPKNKVSIITTGKFEVEDAYLVFEDGTKVLGDSNITEVNKKLILMIVIKSGWKAIDNKVKVKLGQEILTNTGASILKNNDVFEGKGVGSLEDAKYIQVKSVITTMTKPIKYFTVKFIMTDLIGKGTISGSYRFYIKA